MNYAIIMFIIGCAVRVESLFMLLPFAAALIYNEPKGYVFLPCAVLFYAIGWIMSRNVPKSTHFYAREGFISVSASWLILSFFGAVPFVISKTIPSPVDAMFEIVSGFTTTGASIIPNVELLPKSYLFWRSFSHWLGGMGILVFVLVLLPFAGGQSIHLIRAESTGPQIGKLVPRMQRTAIYLYTMYFALSLIQLVFLLIAGMPLFDALCDVFGTAGTGGFGIKADSMAGYNSAIQNITTIFMLLFGINFNFYFFLCTRRFKAAFGIEEVRWYFIIYILACVGIYLNMFFVGRDPSPDVHHIAFQVSSVMTSTGYATVDFDKWPQLARTIMVGIMFTGACAGSTGGGIKVVRFVLYFKQFFVKMSSLLHPRSVKVVKMDGQRVDDEVLQTTNTFFFIYTAIFAASMFILAWDNMDFTTNFTAVAATLNNIGPGLSGVGPTSNFAAYSDLSKIVMIFDMLAGRLEIFPMLVLLAPATWRRNG
ncbi:MAG: TrkH family potassium uptake protein [Firmicutes bacterium]|nr:TrkH family potassium uptake protein [Bacillota bacterium]